MCLKAFTRLVVKEKKDNYYLKSHIECEIIKLVFYGIKIRIF